MIRPRVQSVSSPPFHFNPTFVDRRGVTHETLGINKMDDMSMCGQPHGPSRASKTRSGTLRAFARSLAPDGVDCMSCLVQRARLDGMVAGPQIKSGHLMVEIDLVTEALR